jgi:hypothetical protein
MSSTIVEWDGKPILYREGDTGITRIPCVALTKQGHRCKRDAEWVQVTGPVQAVSVRLVCHVHRFSS